MLIGIQRWQAWLPFICSLHGWVAGKECYLFRLSRHYGLQIIDYDL